MRNIVGQHSPRLNELIKCCVQTNAAPESDSGCNTDMVLTLNNHFNRYTRDETYRTVSSYQHKTTDRLQIFHSLDLCTLYRYV